MNNIIYAILFCCLLPLSACDDPVDEKPVDSQVSSSDDNANFIQCPENRPDVCTQIYQPVCAQVDTGVRCVTTPCPSAEYKTLGNACTACSDEKVAGYIEGECEIDVNQEGNHTK